MRAVGVDRARRQRQRLGDLAGGKAARDEIEHFPLARRQAGEETARPSVTLTPRQERRTSRKTKRLAGPLRLVRAVTVLQLTGSIFKHVFLPPLFRTHYYFFIR